MDTRANRLRDSVKMQEKMYTEGNRGAETRTEREGDVLQRGEREKRKTKTQKTDQDPETKTARDSEPRLRGERAAGSG